ncbi:neuroblast differentiation-associated protein AHNAK-like [Anabas testudineus]|uniref:neuroblast differentiation-associated protein AHNAK-like n=1 Tax=Anabas testudineus TaxID=64144 RepID=UPI000E461436|nr:neuroblast differentiation-associated protein AHNAK-like [Anabas testudineus]
MCDCFHLAFPNWHAASSGTGGRSGRRLRGPEPGTEGESVCDEPSQFTEGERPRPQGSSPVEEYPETEKYTDSDQECEGGHEPHHKSGSGKKTKKSGLGSMFEKRSTPKMSKLKEAQSPESGVIVKTAKDGCAEGLVYGGGGKEGIFIKEVVPESPASKSLKLQEGDQILSATVYFDNMSYEDAIQILEHAQAYKVKLCLKRKPHITETQAAIGSDVIPEEELYAPEMREQGKTKRRGDARISWPKFPTLGRKSHFIRSHSSSEADEQRKLELSPTTSDTESPIKSQDALKGKKRHKMKLPVLKNRGRISSSEDQDTEAPTTGQISGDTYQTASEMLSPECLESPLGETPEIYVTEDVKVVEAEQDIPTTVQHRVELISIDSTLKTTDLTVALSDQDGVPGIKSPDGKKKKKERSELKIKISGKDKSPKKDAKAKSSPKRLKTLGASFELAEKPENDTQLITSESSKAISKKSVTTQKEISVPKVELDMFDVTFMCKAPKKGEEKAKKGRDVKQKQETTFKLPKIGLSDIATEEPIQKTDVNVEEYAPKIEEVKEDPYDRLSKSGLSRTQLPKREDIEIPGMEDISRRNKAKKIKEPKAAFTGQYEEIQLSIDVDSVKEAVSKLPGYKLPKVDTSGMPIPEEITVIDANAQRISVKTPTKVVDTKTKHEGYFTKFDMIASPQISMTTVKLPKITSADLTSEELLSETRIGKDYKTQPKQSVKEIKTEGYKQQETVQDGAILQAQETTETKCSEGIALEHKVGNVIIPTEADKKSKKSKTTIAFTGITKPDIKIPDIGFHLPKQMISEQKVDTVKGKRTIFLQEVKTSQTETMKGEGQIRGERLSDVKIPEIDDIEYIDSVGGSPAKVDGVIRLTSLDVNIDAAKPRADVSFADTRGHINYVEAKEFPMKQPKDRAVTLDVSTDLPHVDINIDRAEMKTLEREEKESTINIPNLSISIPKIKGSEIDLTRQTDVSVLEQKMKTEKPELEVKPLQTDGELDGQKSKFKMPKLGIKMPKIKGPEFDLNLSKKHVDVTLPEAKGEVILPEVPEVGSVDLSITEQRIEVEKPELEIKPMQIEGEVNQQGIKIKMPKLKGPEFDLSFSKKDVDVTLTETEAEVKPPEVPEVGSVDVLIPDQKIEVEKPEFEIKPLQTEGELDAQGTRFKMPKLGIKMPKIKGPEFDLSLSKKDVDVTLPEAKAEVKLPEVPEVGAIDLSIPEQRTEAEKNEFEVKPLQAEGELDGEGIKFKMPKFGIKMPKIKGPEFDLSLSKKDTEVLLPEAKAEVKLPKAPDVDVTFESVNVSLPEQKMKIKEPELEVQPLQTEGEHDAQGTKFKMPKFGFKMPKIKGPEFDLSLSKKDVDVALSQTKAEVKPPEVPEVGSVDVLIPDQKIEIEKPEFEVKPLQTEGELDAQGTRFKMPKLGIKMPKIKGPEFDLSLSKKDVDVTLPEAKAEVKLPEVPEVGAIDLSIPEQRTEAEKNEFEVKPLQAEGELDGEGIKFKMPKFGIKMPKIKGPEFDLSLSKKDTEVLLPEAKAEVKLPKAPDVDVTFESVNVSLPEQKMKIKEPELEVQPLQTEGEHDAQGTKFKMPKFGFKMPKIKGPEFDLSLSKKDVDVTLPEDKAEVKLPEVPEVGAIDLSIPEQRTEAEKTEFEVKPLQARGELDGEGIKFKMPKFGIKMPKIKGPEFDLSLSKKDADVLLPEAKAEDVNVTIPEVNLPEVPEAGSVCLSIPEHRIEVEKPELEIKPLQAEGDLERKGIKFKIPKLGLKMPKVEGPEFDVSLSKEDVDVKMPEAKAEVKLPDIELKDSSAKVEIKAPQVKGTEKDAEGSPSKFKMPTFKLPKFGIGTSNASVEVPDADIDLKIEGADITIPEQDPVVDIAASNMYIESPSMHQVDFDAQGNIFKLPKLGVSMPKVKGPEIHFGSSKEEDVTLLQAEREVTTSGQKHKMPKFGIKIPEVKGTEMDLSLPKKDIDMTLQQTKVEPELPDDPKIDVCLGKAEILIPEAQVKVTKPEVKPLQTHSELKGRGGQFKMPKFGITMPKARKPEIDLSLSKKHADTTLPDIKAEVKLPDVELKQPSAEMEAPEIKAVTKDKKESPSKFKMPTFKLPKYGVGSPSASVDVPDMDKDMKIDGADIKIPEKVLAVSIEQPSIKGPSIDLKTAETEHEVEGGKFKLPTLGFSVSKAKGLDTDLNLPKTDVDVTLPEVKAEVKLPDVELKQPSAEVEAPEIKAVIKDKKGSPSKFKMPTFKFPKFGVGSPSASVDVPDMDKDIKIDGADIKIPEEVLAVSIEQPSIEGPSIDLKTAETEHEVEGGKFKLPTLGFSVSKAKGLDTDLNLPKTDVDVTLPEVRAEVKLPDVELKQPSAEVEAPEIKAVIKDKKGSPSKFKMPTFKFPKFGIGSPSASVDVPDMDKDIKIDGVDIKIPEEVLAVSIEQPSIEGPSIDLKTAETEHEVEGGKFKLPTLGFSVSKAKGLDTDLNLPKTDVDVTLPEVKAEVKLPDVELKQPSAEVEAPEIKAVIKDKKGSPPKFKMPTFKFPKFGIGSPSASVDVPDMDKDMKIDGADIKIPEEVLTVSIAQPSIEGPSIDLKTAETEHEVEGGKFKLPTLGFSVSKAKGLDTDLKLPKTDVDVTLPEVKAEVKLPDVELKQPSAEVEAPEIKAVIKDKKGSPSKFKMPTFKFPKFGVGSPSASVDVPDMDKDIKIDGADIEIPEEVLTVSTAQPSIEGPSIDLKTAETEHEVEGGKFKLPTLGFSVSKAKGLDTDLKLPKTDVDVTLPEVKAEVKLPDVELKQPSAEVEAPEIKAVIKDKKGSPSKFKMPTFKFPKFGIGSPSASVDVPDMDKDMKIDGADIKIPEEVLAVSIAQPSIEGPSIDLKTAETEHEVEGGKFKLPTLGFSVSKAKGLDTDLKLPKTDVDVTLPEVKAEVKLPDVELKQPSAEVEAPEIKAVIKDKKGSPSKFKMPTFKLPKFGVGSPSASVDVPDMDKDIKIDGADIEIPEEVLAVSIAQPSIEGPSIDLKTAETEHEVEGGKFKLPTLGFSVSKAKGLDTDLKLPKTDVDVTLPEVKAEVKLPDVELKQPSAEVEAPEIKAVIKDKKGSPSKFKMPTFKFPKFGVGSPSASVDVPDMDKDIKIDGADIEIPEEVLAVSIAQPSIEGPSIDLKTAETEHEVEGGKFKMPTLGFSVSKAKGLDTDLKLPKTDVDVTLPEVRAEVKLPDVELKQPSAEVEAPEIKAVIKDKKGSPSKFKMPTFKLPKFGVGSPSASVDVPDMDKDMKIDGGDIKIPEEVLAVSIEQPSIPAMDKDIKLDISDSKVPEAKADVQLSGVEIRTEGDAKFKKPRFSLPKFSFSKQSVKEPKVDVNLQYVDVALPEGNVEVRQPEVDLRPPEDDIELGGQESKFKLPKFSISVPKVKGPEINWSLSKTDIDGKLPEAKADIELPDVKLQEQAAILEVKVPQIETGTVQESPSKLKMPEIPLPKFGAATSKVSVPDVDKDIDGEDGKFKMPKFGISIPKVKGAETDLSMSTNDTDITIPDVEAHVTVPSGEFKELEGAFSVPDAAMVKADDKLKRPNWTFPKFSFLRTGKAPDTDINLQTSKMDVTSAEAKAEDSLPDVELKGTLGAISMEGSPAAELDANLKKTKFSLPTLSFSKSSAKETKLSVEHPHGDVSIPEGEVKVKPLEMEIKAPELEAEYDEKISKFKLPKFGTAQTKAKAEIDFYASQKHVEVSLPEANAEVTLPGVEIKESSASVETKASETEARLKDVAGSPSKFKMPTVKMPKFGGASYDVTIKAPAAHIAEAETDGGKFKEDVSDQIADIKIDASKAAVLDSETTKTESADVDHGSPSKFKLPLLKMPKLSFSRPRPEDEYVPVDTESKDDQLEVEVESKGESKSPKKTLTSLGEILKNIDVEFDVSTTDKVEVNLETSKEVHATDEPSGKRLETKEKQSDTTISPERTGWFKFPKFGLSSPTELAKHKDEKSPVGETGDEESPTFSVQSSDAFADISSTMTSEHVGLSLSSPTKVTVKYCDPNAAAGLGEVHSNIITSTTKTEMISVEPNLPEKITILSSGVSSSSEDTLRLESGKIHVITSNIQATPEAHHAKLLTAVQVQSAGGLPLKSEAKEAAAWTVEDLQSSRRTVVEKHLIRETSGERSETIVITKQITHTFDSSEPISGETASSIRRLKDSVHSDKMKFFDEAEK